MMEICVHSIQSAKNAEQGGASRLELCTCLEVGGVTPSIGLLQEVKEVCHIPVFVLIRPRAADFLYSAEEIQIMKKDIIAAKESKADGFVIGVLDQNGNIDQEQMTEMMDLCNPLPVTFHRAIDMCQDPVAAVEIAIQLGCKRVLTSGQHPSAYEGRDVIRKMNEKANGRITIMPGAGITEDNLEHIIKATGCQEFHASAKHLVDSKMTFRGSLPVAMGTTSREYQYFECNPVAVQKLVQIIKEFTA